ncbi:hypothetical protein NDU88_004732 [Pleurodeles waltl]|uniref:Uncharacterized protein n=1 Tax=Pleurodeles waltl TaxID=8319 RepID=A0AAV7SJM2_PLEWA|nr:hypothetical protein NDU88_004732 [Pleurodeles waltl]
MLLMDDPKGPKKDLAQDVKAIHKDLTDVGDRVSASEDKETPREEEVKHLQQEVLRLQEQHIDIQAHAEDLENRSRLNNIPIRGVPHEAENEDVEFYVQVLFTQILDCEDPVPIQNDRAHRVNPPWSRSERPADVLVCLHDFTTKRLILRQARDQHPLKFKGHAVTLYQDLSALTLQECKDFHSVTSFLRNWGISYSWGHPFRLTSKWEEKIISANLSRWRALCWDWTRQNSPH